MISELHVSLSEFLKTRLKIQSCKSSSHNSSEWNLVTGLASSHSHQACTRHVMTNCTFRTPLVCAAAMPAGPSDRAISLFSMPLTSLCIRASFRASRAGSKGPHLSQNTPIGTKRKTMDSTGMPHFLRQASMSLTPEATCGGMASATQCTHLSMPKHTWTPAVASHLQQHHLRRRSMQV